MTLLKDRERRAAVTHRIAMGRPGNPTLSSGREKWFHALDHFEITGVEQDSKTEQFTVDAEAMSRLKVFDGDKRYASLRRVPIRLSSNKIEDFLKQEYESRAKLPVLGPDGVQKIYKKREKRGNEWVEVEVAAAEVQVWCHGDGVEAQRRQKDGKSKCIRCASNKRKLPERSPAELLDLLRRKVAHVPDDGKLCPWAQNDDAKAFPTCKPTTLLICRSDVVSNLGSFCKFRSSGHATADELYTSLTDIQKSLGGVLEDVPLDLVMTMKDIRKNGTGKAQPVAHVELRTDLDSTYRFLNERLKNRGAMLEAMRTQALLPAAMADAEVSTNAELSRVLDPAKPGGALGAIVDAELVEKDKQ